MRNLRDLVGIANNLNYLFVSEGNPFRIYLDKIPIGECDNMKIEVLECRIYPLKFSSNFALDEVKQIKKWILSELNRKNVEEKDVDSVRVLIDFIEENGKRKFNVKAKIFVKGKEFTRGLEYPPESN